MKIDEKKFQVLFVTMFAGYLMGFSISTITYFIGSAIKNKKPLASPLPEVVYVEKVIQPEKKERNTVPVRYGKASYYDRSICDLHGTTYGIDCLTANGDRFNDEAWTAACSKELLGKELLVGNQTRAIVVYCNDTGSFSEKYGRIIDLSKGAFEELASKDTGVIEVWIEEL